MRLKILHADGTHVEIAPTAQLVRLGRDADCEVQFDSVAYPRVSGRHAIIERIAGGLELAHASQHNPTLLNGRAVEGRARLSAGDAIRLGMTGPVVIVLATTGSAIDQPRESRGAPAGGAPLAPSDVTLAAGTEHQALLRGTGIAPERIEIASGGAIGRERGKVQILLEHPHVSRFHASLAVAGGRVTIADNRSANGTFVNGHRIERPVDLVPGDCIDIGPFSLEFDGAALISRSRVNHIELACRGVTRVVKNRATGQPLTLLSDINLVVKPREFICILGPSGSGKSTLLAILSGRNAPNEGAILVNGTNLYAHFDALKQDLAVVAQKDVLHESLPLAEALRYTAELRLPPDTSREELDEAVADILEIVGLTRRQETLIRYLSGGQIKRASLANELVARPSLLFLDEVTSGLDEQTDRDMMDLFRQIADGGKTVVCITHSLANVEATCHLVVILTEGGRLACVGTPDEARTYFGISRLGDVYRLLAGQSPDEWQARFAASPLFARYVRARQPQEGSDRRRAASASPENDVRPSFWRQTAILTRRYLAIWLGDIPALIMIMGQSLCVAILMVIVYGNVQDVESAVDRAVRTGSAMFMLSVSSFWQGCNIAAKELVKERVSFSRERDINLRISSYFTSKVLVLFLFGFIQVMILFGNARLFCGITGPALEQWMALSLLTLCGTCMGLAISAVSPSEEVAVAIVPSAVLPQIILAGTVVPLSGLGKFLAQTVCTVYWGKQNLESLLPLSDLKLAGNKHPDFFLSLGLLLVHTAVFIAVSVFVLWRSGKKSA